MKRLDYLKSKIHLLIHRLPGHRGSTLAYIAMVLIIFGVIGAAMISLLTSAVTSSVTPNYARTAQYMSEAGMRYAMSQLRNNDFDSDIVDELNTTEYVLATGDKFELNVFSLWFRSPSDESVPMGGAQITGTIEEGEIPANFSMTAGNIYTVNIESAQDDGAGNLLIPASGTESTAAIQSYTINTSTSMTLDLGDDFEVNKDNRVCLAVHPYSNTTHNSDESLFVHADARFIFPKHDGAVYIKNQVVYYNQAIYHDVAPTRLELTRASPGAGAVTTNDYVILWPSNHLITSTGISESVSQGVYPASSININDPGDLTIAKKGGAPPDLDLENMNLLGPTEGEKDIREIESDSGFITADDTGKSLDIGSGIATPEFGNVWYDENKPIGGQTNYCSAGACLFKWGVRVFFLLDFISQGDGITFSLINDATNTAGSAGGDVELSELMGYAGDSRLDAGGTSFLDGTLNGEGLQPPKLAVEFDTRTNNPTLEYCADVNTINENTRNDPLASDQDAVQYVFWGSPILDLDCRSGVDNQSYDDNRHDAGGLNGTEKWRFGNPAGPISVWRPAIGPDGTIYISALDATLYAIEPEARLAGLPFPQPGEWTFALGDNSDYMPGIDPNSGTIYSDIAGNSIVAIDPNGNQLWQFNVNSDIDSTPTVGPDGRVYFGTDFEQSLYAIDPAARAAAMPFPQPNEWKFPTGGEIDNVPALNSDASVVYFVSKDHKLYAVNTADGTERWQFPIPTEPNEIDSSPTVDPTDGTIYVGADDNNLYAINPDGTEKWRFPTGGEIESSAAQDPIDGAIYIGSDDSKVWAINPDGTEKWQFVTGNAVESSAIIDSDGTILIGSLDGKFYALNLDGTEKWNFPTGNSVPSSPALGADGSVYIGSNDTNFYAINQFAEPRNNKELFLTSNELGPGVSVDDANDWLNGDLLKGPWAVRLEVDRSILPNAGGRFNYKLSLWIRQCQNFDCSDITGTFFQDTRLDYEYSAVADLPMTQQFVLNPDDQGDFNRFLFGFTGATGAGQPQRAIISLLQLSFIRPGDPVVTTDPNW